MTLCGLNSSGGVPETAGAPLKSDFTLFLKVVLYLVTYQYAMCCTADAAIGRKALSKNLFLY